jgi:hypothetical protein
MNVERLFRWSALAWSALGFAAMALDPAAVLQGFGHPRL